MEQLKQPAFLLRLLLLFWALFFTLVLASNLTDGLQQIGWLPAEFAFVSGNYGMMEQVTAIYNTPGWILVILFLGVLLWEGLAVWLLWRAFWLFPGDRPAVQAAFTVAILLTAAFILMDELFLVFRIADLEKAHQLLFISLLGSLFFVRAVAADRKA